MNETKSYQYLLIDWDGCLADTLSIWMDAYLYFYRHYGVEDITEEKVIATSWGNWEEGPQNVGIDENVECINKIWDRVIERRFDIKLYDGVKETVERLAGRGKTMGVVSSSRRIQVVEPMEKIGISQYFKTVYCAEDVKNVKPDPEILVESLKEMQGSKDQAIVIGDSSGDILSGQNAKIDSALYYPKENHRFYIEEKLRELNSTYFITHFSQLLDIIN